MNRKERRAAAKRSAVRAAPQDGGLNPLSADELFAEARRHYQQGRSAQARDLCDRLVAREPSHVEGLNLLAVIAQQSGRHKPAIKLLEKAIAADALHGGCHYNLAFSYQAMGLRDKAAMHFRQAIVIGMSDRDVIEHIEKNPTVGACLGRLAKKWPLPIGDDELFGVDGLDALASDVFLQCAMELITIRGWAFELLLTHLRSALLRLAEANAREPSAIGEKFVDCFCALAQQCFINEYIFTLDDEEARLAQQWRDVLSARIASGGEVPPIMLAAVAAYFPLLSIATVDSLLQQTWPDSIARLLRQQVREPLEEARDRSAIPKLTAVDDGISREVMRQYEENPYPRWTLPPLAPLSRPPAGNVKDILIAGCGTGQHPIQVALSYPEARILAVDLSLNSLAYARRKSREEGVHNIKYAQADILKLATIGRSFDRIETVGVLHHLAEPKLGWRTLLPLLRPGGDMRIGLYSQLARRPIVEARALIAAQGYRPTAEDIQKCRQFLMRAGWRDLSNSTDFHSVSGCRDLLFNVMEHRFTIPEIKGFLDEHGLTFLGFELGTDVVEKFQRQFPGAGALANLDCWHEFETANPLTFDRMYIFTVRNP